MTPGGHGTTQWRIAAVTLVVLATLVPVLLALVLAKQQARSDQAKRAATYAADVLHRGEQTGDQIADAFRLLAGARAGTDCGPETRALLQRLDATSSYVQMYGVMRGDTVACSSYGVLDPPLDIGPADYVSSTGMQIRQDTPLVFAPEASMSVVSDGRYVAFVHRMLPVDMTLRERGASLALLTASRAGTFSARGRFEPEWRPANDRLAPGQKRTVLIGDHVVAQIRSERYDLIAIAALDAADYTGTFTRFARLLVPFGLVIGALFAWLLLRVAKAQAGMPAAIRAGLRGDEFFILLQPIVDLSTRRWVGAEVLLRWRRPGGQMVRPDLFIPVAEENGSILAITARVLDKTEPVLAALAKHHPHAFLSINLSPQDLLAEQTLPRLKQLIANTGARPDQVHVEVTERGFADTLVAGEQVKRLRAAGVCVAIDDFGTGYSSLSELVAFELDTLKIDKTFVDTIGGETVTSHVAFHIVEMARALKLSMIAEGIEHEAQAAILQQWRVPFGQGWLFSKPLPPEEFLRALGEHAPAGLSGGHGA